MTPLRAAATVDDLERELRQARAKIEQLEEDRRKLRSVLASYEADAPRRPFFSATKEIG